MFRDVSAQAGIEFTRLDVARGLATGDIDNDGDVERSSPTTTVRSGSF